MARDLVIAEKQQAVLGLRVLRAMHRQGWTIPHLARVAGVPLSTVQKLVAGASRQPSVWTVWLLAQALGVSLDHLTDAHCTPHAAAAD